MYKETKSIVKWSQLKIFGNDTYCVILSMFNSKNGHEPLRWLYGDIFYPRISHVPQLFITILKRKKQILIRATDKDDVSARYDSIFLYAATVLVITLNIITKTTQSVQINLKVRTLILIINLIKINDCPFRLKY